jgi:hypothetical protein
MTSIAGFVIAASMVVGQADAEQTLKGFADFVVGGVWKLENQAEIGNVSEVRFRWILGEKFLERSEQGQLSRKAIIGIGPDKKVTEWRFSSKGSLLKSSITRQGDGVWVIDGTGTLGTGGNFALTLKYTKQGDNEVRIDMLKYTLQGEAQPLQSSVWKRRD